MGHACFDPSVPRRKRNLIPDGFKDYLCWPCVLRSSPSATQLPVCTATRISVALMGAGGTNNI